MGGPAYNKPSNKLRRQIKRQLELQSVVSNIQVYDRQAQFISAAEPIYAFIGGVGSGKSTAGAVYTLQQIARYPMARGFIGANTYLQLHKSTLIKLFSLLQQTGAGWKK